MASPVFEVALFQSDGDGGVRLLGRTTDPALVNPVRERVAAERRRELATMERPVRLVRTETEQE